MGREIMRLVTAPAYRRKTEPRVKDARPLLSMLLGLGRRVEYYSEAYGVSDDSEYMRRRAYDYEQNERPVPRRSG